MRQIQLYYRNSEQLQAHNRAMTCIDTNLAFAGGKAAQKQVTTLLEFARG